MKNKTNSPTRWSVIGAIFLLLFWPILALKWVKISNENNRDADAMEFFLLAVFGTVFAIAFISMVATVWLYGHTTKADVVIYLTGTLYLILFIGNMNKTTRAQGLPRRDLIRS